MRMRGEQQAGPVRQIMAIFLLLLVPAGTSTAKYSGGTGEPNDPYRIATPEDLNDIGNHVEDYNKHFVMVNDINIAEYTGSQFNIIGDYLSQPFTGVFDGNNHTISNFNYQSTQQNEDTGIFGYVSDTNAVIRDVRLRDPNIRGAPANYAGALVAVFESGTVRGCSVEGGIIVGRLAVGALIGWSGPDDPSWPGAKLTECYAETDVQATHDCAGGLVGSNLGGIGGFVSNCYAKGDVEGLDWVGGLVGNNYGSMTDCYATGAVAGQDNAGGLVGFNAGPIANSYSTGPVSGITDVGGLLGANSGVVSNCFWDIETSGRINMCGRNFGSGCNDRLYGKTTAEMQTPSTFTDAGWDFVGEQLNGTENIWRLCNEGLEYPKLNCRMPEGDLFCPDGVSGQDFAYLAARWADINCADSNDCHGVDFDLSGRVDEGDLSILCDHWLEGLDI